jgi:hypothetical protein
MSNLIKLNKGIFIMRTFLFVAVIVIASYLYLRDSAEIKKEYINLKKKTTSIIDVIKK